MMKTRFGKSKHKKFRDDWEKAKEPVVEGITFYVKYIGMSMVDKANDENCTAEGVKKIVNQAKGAKANKVSLKVTPQGIVQTDVETEVNTLEVSIYRISYCTADKTNEKVFGFISQNPYNDSLELHAYLCSKRKVAEAIALTVSHSFNIAFEKWEERQETNNKTNQESGEMVELTEQVSSMSVSAPLDIPNGGRLSENGVEHMESSLGASPVVPSTSVVISPPPRNPRGSSSSRHCSSPSSLPPPPPPPRQTHSRSGQSRHSISNSTIITTAETHVSPSNHDSKFQDSNLDECFSKLAESRTKPQILSSNIEQTDLDNRILNRLSGHFHDKDSILDAHNDLMSL